MRYRKLRIVWSMTWGIVAVLLIVLWVRSYRMTDVNLLRVGDLYWHQDPSANMYQVHFYGGRLHLTYAWPAAVRWAGRLALDVPIPNRADSSFGAFHNPGSVGIRMPLWLPTILAALFSSAPWMAHAKRFSLRILLIAMTLVAVGLGLVVWAINK